MSDKKPYETITDEDVKAWVRLPLEKNAVILLREILTGQYSLFDARLSVLFVREGNEAKAKQAEAKAKEDREAEDEQQP